MFADEEIEAARDNRGRVWVYEDNTSVCCEGVIVPLEDGYGLIVDPTFGFNQETKTDSETRYALIADTEKALLQKASELAPLKLGTFD